jgi:hypothetical protein
MHAAQLALAMISKCGIYQELDLCPSRPPRQFSLPSQSYTTTLYSYPSLRKTCVMAMSWQRTLLSSVMMHR